MKDLVGKDHSRQFNLRHLRIAGESAKECMSRQILLMTFPTDPFTISEP